MLNVFLLTRLFLFMFSLWYDSEKNLYHIKRSHLLISATALLFSVFWFFFFFGRPAACGVPGPGMRCEPQLPPLYHSCGSAGSLTHCAGPGIARTCVPVLPRCHRSWCVTAGTHHSRNSQPYFLENIDFTGVPCMDFSVTGTA